MIDKLIQTIRKDKKLKDKFQNVFVEKVVSSKTIILNEGEVANKVYFIKKGVCANGLIKTAKTSLSNFFSKTKPLLHSIVL